MSGVTPSNHWYTDWLQGKGDPIYAFFDSGMQPQQIFAYPPFTPELKREEKFVPEQNKEKETYSEVVQKGDRKRKNDQVDYVKMRIPELEVIMTHCQCSEKGALELWNKYKDTSYIIQHFGVFQ
jgi:hypothetical protein